MELLNSLLIDFIALVVAIISLGLSVYNFISAKVSRRVKLSVSIQKYESYMNRAIFHLSISNKSELAISIENFSILLNDRRLDCQQLSEQCTYQSDSKSSSLPMTVQALGAASCVVDLRDRSTLLLRCRTNRRKELKIQLQLPAKQRHGV